MRPTISKIITVALLSSVACGTDTSEQPVGEEIREAWESAVTTWEVVEVAYKNWEALSGEGNEKGYDNWEGGPIVGEAEEFQETILDAVEDTFEALEVAWESTSDAWNVVANTWEVEVGFSMAEVARSAASQARSASKARETAIRAFVAHRTSLSAHNEVGRALDAYYNASTSDLIIAYAVGNTALEALRKIYDIKTAQRETAGNAAWESVGEASTQFARVSILAEETFKDPAWKDVADAWEEVADTYFLASVTDYSAVDATILIVGAIKKTKEAIIGLQVT